MKPYNGDLLIGDNLPFMKKMEFNSVDLIYMDPPFNTDRDWGEYNDRWHQLLAEDLPDKIENVCYMIEFLHSNQMGNYCRMLGIRLLEMYRLLKINGSIFIHCNGISNSYIRILMDVIFGKDQYLNEIIWCYKGAPTQNNTYFHRKYDSILFYCRDKHAKDRVFNVERTMTENLERFYSKGFNYASVHRKQLELVIYDREKEGAKKELENWKGSVSDYTDKPRGRPIYDWWTQINPLAPVARERVGYPTQKPLRLLHRIIKCASNPGDLVLDPFCGSGTTLVAAEQLKRKWIGIDLNEKVKDILEARLNYHCYDHIGEEEKSRETDD